jgi:hypothetical protein
VLDVVHGSFFAMKDRCLGMTVGNSRLVCRQFIIPFVAMAASKAVMFHRLLVAVGGRGMVLRTIDMRDSCHFAGRPPTGWRFRGFCRGITIVLEVIFVGLMSTADRVQRVTMRDQGLMGGMGIVFPD